MHPEHPRRTGESSARPRATVAMSQGVAERILTPEVRERLRACVELTDGPPLEEFSSEAARAALAGTDILVTGWGCPRVDAGALAAAPRLRLIAHTAGSVRWVATPECWERGVEVTSAAAANALPVAEYTLAMILLANKRVLEGGREFTALRTAYREPGWDPHTGNYRRTVGIVSASMVGRRVIELLRPFDMDVLLYDPYVGAEEAAALGVRPVGLRELCAASDVVSVHAPLLPATRGLLDAAALEAMRPGATLVNTARGAVVDHEALTRLCVAGRIRAVLDVTDPEPLPDDSPLYDCPDVLLTPHVAGSAGNELGRLADYAAAEIERWTASRSLAHAVRAEDLARIA